LQSQNETFSDSRIQLRSGPHEWENKPRRRLRSIVSLTMDTGNLDEHGETKVIQRDGLSPKRIKLEQREDCDIQ